ncbi:MAG TPA: GGDEF domain-containing protein [Gemmatales bacterium]|nr:GGDEF domain-containing protein [Gemmatales bacterium]
MSDDAKRSNQQNLEFLIDTVRFLKSHFDNRIGSPIGGQLCSVGEVEAYREFDNHLAELLQLLQISNHPATEYAIPDNLKPYLKRALIERRLVMAKDVEQKKSRTVNPQILDVLENQLKPFDEFLHETDLQALKPARMPQLRDFLTMEGAERHEQSQLQLKERRYNEKTRCLLVYSLIRDDMEYYRFKCTLRDVPMVFAYIDIDEFKKFNTELGDTKVDRYFLPAFAAALEAHVYGRGYAYQYGGDEYAVILPNTTVDLAGKLLGQFQEKLRSLAIRNSARKVTVSIGFCTIDQDTYYTNEEIVSKAEEAKSFAKSDGRDRIATYRTELFEKEGLYVIMGSDSK